MGRSRKHSAALKAKRVGEKPRGFYESPGFDLEFNFTADTKCLHEVIYLRGEGTCGAMGDTLNEAIECFGGLDALDEDVFNTAKDEESFKNLFNPMIESIVFGDEDYGFQINRGSAISRSEYAA